MPVNTRKITDAFISESDLLELKIARDDCSRIRSFLKAELSRIYAENAKRFFNDRRIDLRSLVTEVRSSNAASRISGDAAGRGTELTLDIAFAGFAARNVEVAECNWSHSEEVVDEAMRGAMSLFAEKVCKRPVERIGRLEREVIRLLFPEHGWMADLVKNTKTEEVATSIRDELLEAGLACPFTGPQIRRIALLWYKPWGTFLAMAFEHGLAWSYRI